MRIPALPSGSRGVVAPTVCSKVPGLKVQQRNKMAAVQRLGTMQLRTQNHLFQLRDGMKALRVLGWCAVPCALLVLSWLCWRFWLSPQSEEEPAGPPWFVEVTEKTGLRFVHDAG